MWAEHNFRMLKLVLHKVSLKKISTRTRDSLRVRHEVDCVQYLHGCEQVETTLSCIHKERFDELDNSVARKTAFVQTAPRSDAAI